MAAQFTMQKLMAERFGKAGEILFAKVAEDMWTAQDWADQPGSDDVAGYGAFAQLPPEQGAAYMNQYQAPAPSGTTTRLPMQAPVARLPAPATGSVTVAATAPAAPPATMGAVATPPPAKDTPPAQPRLRNTGAKGARPMNTGLGKKGSALLLRAAPLMLRSRLLKAAQSDGRLPAYVKGNTRGVSLMPDGRVRLADGLVISRADYDLAKSRGAGSTGPGPAEMLRAQQQSRDLAFANSEKAKAMRAQNQQAAAPAPVAPPAAPAPVAPPAARSGSGTPSIAQIQNSWRDREATVAAGRAAVQQKYDRQAELDAQAMAQAKAVGAGRDRVLQANARGITPNPSDRVLTGSTDAQIASRRADPKWTDDRDRILNETYAAPQQNEEVIAQRAQTRAQSAAAAPRVQAAQTAGPAPFPVGGRTQMAMPQGGSTPAASPTPTPVPGGGPGQLAGQGTAASPRVGPLNPQPNQAQNKGPQPVNYRLGGIKNPGALFGLGYGATRLPGAKRNTSLGMLSASGR